MTEQARGSEAGSDGPILSVRAQAVRSVPPDLVSLSGAVEVTSASKAEAVAEAGRVQRRILYGLESLGGAPLRAGDGHRSLGWLTRRVSTHPEHAFDPAKQQHGPTGRVVAQVIVEIQVRDFDLLESVDALLAGVEEYSSHHAQWSVDPDNPAWAGVRADAIHDALRQADDYASALTCTVSRVEQVADAGLLADASTGRAAMPAAAGGWTAQSRSGMGGPPSLDPEPQQVSAMIDVRCATRMLPA